MPAKDRYHLHDLSLAIGGIIQDERQGEYHFGYLSVGEVLECCLCALNGH
jgi:hypothetical protein